MWDRRPRRSWDIDAPSPCHCEEQSDAAISYRHTHHPSQSQLATRTAENRNKEGILNNRSDLQPFTLEDPITWDCAPGWYEIGPSALTVITPRNKLAQHSESANGAPYTSLGRSPRKGPIKKRQRAESPIYNPNRNSKTYKAPSNQGPRQICSIFIK
jgi:hypothetical protein